MTASVRTRAYIVASCLAAVAAACGGGGSQPASSATPAPVTNPVDPATAGSISGTVSLMGKSHSVETVGSLKKADAAALARLELKGDVLIAEADFALVIKETALASDASTFKGDRFPVHVSLVLRHTGEE